MVDFLMPSMSEGLVDGWGPPATGGIEPQVGICDFVEHLDKFPLTRIGRICDFTASGQKFQAERAKGKNAKGQMKGKAVVPAPVSKDDEGFSLVDSQKLPGKSAGRGKGNQGRGKGRGKGLIANYQEGILGQKQKPLFQTDKMQKGGKGKGGRGKGGAPRRNALPSFKEWSVLTKTEWVMKRDISLSNLAKLQIDAKEVKYEDLMWCGKLHSYNRQMDRISAKTEMPMRRFEELEFYNVSTVHDPHLTEMLQHDDEVCMIATDHVLACLVAAARSVYSWDIVVTKIKDKLIFDKRSGSIVDFLSVNETAAEPPLMDDKESINSPVKLSQEASCINQNFSQMVLDLDGAPKEMDNPNPFEEDDEDSNQVASGAYRYRKITLPGNPKAENQFERNPVTLIVRTEVNCRMPEAHDDKGLVSVKALNEYEPKLSYSWRLHLESQRGRCLATELTNNAFKLGRWTAQAILAGCDTMKLGYVSRVQPNDTWSHTVLGVQTHMTDGFAEQIGLTRNNMFGILRTIIDLAMQWEDGKYLILKDPTKSVLRIYDVPPETFESDDDDGDGDEEEEEEQELDEDGNVAPAQPA